MSNAQNINNQEAEFLEKMRHTSAHVLAQAVLKLYPDTKLGIGPAIDDGFYYDFEFQEPITNDVLPKIEAEMKKIIKADLPLTQEFHPRDKVVERFEALEQKYKLDLLESIHDKKISLYITGDSEFTDLCRGPHVESTGQIGAIKLLRIAGAYWKGDENNPMLTRIYGTAFPTQEALDEHLEMLEQAKLRDHRKLGKELNIYLFDDEVGPGLPLWQPNGAIIIEELEKLAKEVERNAGYQQVRTPHVTKENLFLRSGHLPYYADSMYPPMKLDGVNYYVKPMNCPFHHKIYAGQLRSYKDLPIRLSEYGTCYRYEKSGELFGLMRVRSMQMNDAHIYLRRDQFEHEFMGVIDLYMQYFKLFGIDKYLMRLSKHSKEGLGKKYVDNEELWVETENMIKEVMDKAEIPYVEVEDEAAFYGPKIDVQVWSAIGREFTLATNQVDFAVPERFDLTFTNSDGEKETPLCIHRAPLSTHERIIGFLLEHYAGAFPVWLAPLQVKILPITDDHVDYANSIAEKLQSAGVRCEVDSRSEKLGYKIREGEKMKVPYIIVVGDKEVETDTIALRIRGQKEQGLHRIDEFATILEEKIKKRDSDLSIENN